MVSLHTWQLRDTEPYSDDGIAKTRVASLPSEPGPQTPMAIILCPAFLNRWKTHGLARSRQTALSNTTSLYPRLVLLQNPNADGPTTAERTAHTYELTAQSLAAG